MYVYMYYICIVYVKMYVCIYRHRHSHRHSHRHMQIEGVYIFTCYDIYICIEREKESVCINGVRINGK